MGVFVDQTPRTIDDKVGNEADDLVTDRFDKTAAMAEESFNLTKEYIGRLGTTIDSLLVPDTSAISIELPEVLPINFIDRPEFGELVMPSTWPTVPDSPKLKAITSIPNVSIPVASFQPPSWNTPDAPVLDDITAPGDLPQILQPDLPVTPSLTLPAPPTLGKVILPSPPVIDLPEFTSDLQEFEGTLPEGFSWSESPYNSEIWEPLLQNTLTTLQNGGTGLSAKVEADIWNNLLLRQQAMNDAEQVKAEKYFISKGFRLPSGPLVGRLQELSAEFLRNNTDNNQKIAISQAELAQKNTQFNIEKSIQLESILREMFNAHENRILESSKYAAESAIALYNSLVQQYNLQIAKLNADVAVYDAQIRSALSAVEIFKAQVESAKVSADVQKVLVDIYVAELGAVDTTIKLYNAQLEAANMALTVQMSKLEAYKLETQAYVARLDGEKVKVEIYTAQNEAEQSKALVYSKQVDAYVAEIESKKTILSMYTARSAADIQENAALIESYRAQIDGYGAEIGALTAQVNANIEGYKATVDVYQAETGALSQYYATKSLEINTSIQEADLALRKSVAEVDASTKGYIAIKQLELEGSRGMTDIAAAMTASALNAINATVSLSESASNSSSRSVSLDNSLSESHSFSEE